METSNISNNKNEMYFEAYKRMIFINDLNNAKISLKSFLISINTIPIFIKLIKDSIANKNENNNRDEIIKNSLENYEPEKNIQIYHSFEECENIINQNLINENNFIIVDEYFFKYMDINIKDSNEKQVIINIDKNKSLCSVKFPTSGKKLFFIELNPGIYQFKQKKTNNNLLSLLSDKNTSLLNKINSKYIIYEIMSNIKDNNFLLKLIKYSKYIQKKFDINILKYQEIYYSKRLNYDDFLSYSKPEKNGPFELFSFNDEESEEEENKKELIKIIQNEFKQNKINNNAITTFITNYLNNYYNDINKEYSLYEFSKDIDLSCPYFNSLSKIKLFNKIFNILIIEGNIKGKNNIKNKYKSKFEYLNKNNINYPSITFYVGKNKDINILKELNINFNQIKKLKFLMGNDYNDLDKIDFMGMINSFNILDNLVYFEFNLSTNANNNPAQFEIINDFKSLKYLVLSYCNFSTKYELKLNNLKHLKLNYCINIIINKCNLSELNYLKLKYNKIELNKEKENLLPECTKLNKLILLDDNNYNFDFNSFKNLKYFKGNLNNFLMLKETPLLEEIIIKNRIQKSDLNKIIEKRMGIEIKKPEKYYSVKKIELNISNKSNLDMNDFLNIFPNLLELIVKTGYAKSVWTCGHDPVIGEKTLKITENQISKIKNIGIVLIGDDARTVKINCIPYNQIESFDLYADVINIDCFPLFENKCDIIFNSLKIFRFTLDFPSNPSKAASTSIINLFNNIDKMPNLTEFYFCFLNKEKKTTNIINEDLFKEFVKKILSLKSIKKIFFKIREGIWGKWGKVTYSKDELKELFPDINFNKFHEIKIFKFLKKL